LTDDLERRRVEHKLRTALFGTVAPPLTVGRYELLDRIGSGGMSVVYAARDPPLGRRVALKLVSSSIRDPDRRRHYQDRLLREGEALASVAHPNVVSVFDVGEENGHAFLVLELVEGQSLGDWSRAEQRPWREVLEIMLAAGEGLAAAHAAGLVHRDVTPQNIVIDSRGAVRVVDFGLVHAETDDASGDGAPPELLATSLTRTGATMGTPPYMAPEQWLRGTVEARTDQFGFSATLFEAVHGCRPFRGDGAADLERAITSGAVEPAPGDGGAPAWLDPIIRRGLAVDPAQRHPSMQALLAGIRDRLHSFDQTDRAELGLARLCALISGTPSPAAGAIDRAGRDARSACDTALAAWSDNQAAVDLRDDVVSVLLDHELKRENLHAAERLAAELSRPDPERASRIEALRASREAVESRLARLEHIDHEANLDAEPTYKLGLLGLVALSQTIGFLIFGYLTRTGTYVVGPFEVGAFYGIYLLLHGTSMVVFRAAHFANAVNRNLSWQGLVAYGCHTAIFLTAGWMNQPVAAAVVASFVLATALWLMLAIYADPRAILVPPVTALAAVATILRPDDCFEAAAAAAAVGVGAVALSWRPRKRRPAGPPQSSPSRATTDL